MKRLIAAMVFCVIGVAPALGCTLTPERASGKQIETGQRIDQELLSKAVLAETNYFRCQNGLPQLTYSPGLTDVSADHSAWMSKKAKLTHKSTAYGRRSLTQRLNASGDNLRSGAENIAYVSLYDIQGKSFHVSGNCHLTDSKGNSIGPKTYQSLAHELVMDWQKSSAHRKNLMKSGVKTMGAGIGIQPGGQACGAIYATQILAG